MGRFINADSQLNQDSDLGYNMFGYCENDPINKIDPDGHSWKSFKNWVKKTVNSIKKSFKTNMKCLATLGFAIANGVKNKLSKKKGSVSACFAGSGAFGFSISESFGITADTKGNVGIINTVAAGGGTPSYFFGGAYSYSTAPNITYQRRVSGITGGSVSVYGVSLGGECSVTEYGGQEYTTYSVMGGIGAPVDLEFHGEVGYTSVIEIFNIFDEIEKLYKKILEW
jgi:hypothetical protein